MNKEKLNQLISCMKTTNELMKKQLDINQRCIELLGEFITEPESLEPETIKPEDMKAGEWYVLESWYNWILKFKRVSGNRIITFKHASLDGENSILKRGYLTELQRIKSIRKATQEEVLKYFPNELEVPTHGGNDAGYIQEVTDPQV